MKTFFSTSLALLVLAVPVWSQAAEPKPAEDYIVLIPDPAHPKLVPYTAGVTLLGTVAVSGDFNEFADLRKVVLVRCGKKKVIDVRSLRHDPSKDFALEPWDVVYMPPTIF